MRVVGLGVGVSGGSGGGVVDGKRRGAERRRGKGEAAVET